MAHAGTGWDAIQEQIKKLEKKHALHIASYGEGNERRLTGKHETSSMHEFRYPLQSYLFLFVCIYPTKLFLSGIA